MSGPASAGPASRTGPVRPGDARRVVANRSTRPSTAALIDAARMPIFDWSASPPAVPNASSDTNSDTVQPIPPSAATPTTWGNRVPSGMVASPTLHKRTGVPLKQPADLARHVLIHLDDPSGFMPWLNWPAWLTSNGQPNLKPAGSLRFSLYARDEDFREADQYFTQIHEQHPNSPYATQALDLARLILNQGATA